MPSLLDRLREWRSNRKWHRDIDSLMLKWAVQYNKLQLADAQRKARLQKEYQRIHKRKSQNSYVV